MKDNIISLQEKNTKKDYIVILSFVINKQVYLVYTDNKQDEDGFIKTYVAQYLEKDAKKSLLPVNDESILEKVEKLLIKIDGEKEG